MAGPRNSAAAGAFPLRLTAASPTMLIVTSLAAVVLAGGSFASVGSAWMPPALDEALLLVGTASSFLAICAFEARSAS